MLGSAQALALPQREPGAFACPEVAAMCAHRSPGDVEDCYLAMNGAGVLVCVQHTAPIPRQRDDELDRIVPAMQAEVT